MRFCHQMTVPKQDLPVYAKDRLDKAEDENAKLREQVARLQRQRQDQETLHEKRMVAEQKIELERAQERKLAEQQRVAVLKQQEEQVRSERARAEEKALAALQKRVQDLQKMIEQFGSQEKKTDELEKRLPEIGGQGTNTGKVGDRARGSSLLPPLPHPLHPLSSLREIEHWLFGQDE
jgi:DNA repair exonuclease SbcCD ATPase subunit